MNKMTTEQNEEDPLVQEISDAALESMTCAPMGLVGHYTLFYCTQLDLCPGP